MSLWSVLTALKIQIYTISSFRPNVSKVIKRFIFKVQTAKPKNSIRIWYYCANAYGGPTPC